MTRNQRKNLVFAYFLIPAVVLGILFGVPAPEKLPELAQERIDQQKSIDALDADAVLALICADEVAGKDC